MVRNEGRLISPGEPLPHGRGDGPIEGTRILATRPSSPRAWGWSALHGEATAAGILFPTGVGMVRMALQSIGEILPLPHGRGDGPYFALDPPIGPSSSPRAWGWSDSGEIVHVNHRLFPTGVGMVRFLTLARFLGVTLPHGRGDGPPPTSWITLAHRSSPRAWGWSDLPLLSASPWMLFPTGVGMVRTNNRNP